MKRLVLYAMGLLVVVALTGCGLAQGVIKDFGGYGEQLVGKVQPKEYDSYDTSAGTASKSRETAPAPEIVINIDKYTGDVRENDLAVVIGIEQYRSIPASDFSASDAHYMKAYLKAIGFEERNIHLLTNENAALTDIKKAIDGWVVNNATKNSTIFIYYSGHGAPDPASGKAYIVPYDGDPNYLATTSYPLKELYDRLSSIQSAKVVVVLDACFSGAGGRSVLAKGARALVRMEKAAPTAGNVVILSSTQGAQISSSSPEKKHGIFTYYFLEAMKAGKKDIAEIYTYVKPKVENEARRMNVDQSPSISADVKAIKGKYNLW